MAVKKLIKRVGWLGKYVPGNNRTDWYKHPVMRFAWPEINTAIKHLHEEGKPVMPDKVIAGLMFGFMSEVINFL